MRSKVFWAFFITLLILAVLHNIAVVLFLYWTYFWFDIVMHTLGGAVVALGYSTLVLSAGATFRNFLYPGVVPILATTLIVGLTWEVFEILIGIPFDENYVVDTTLDLIADISGALLGYSVVLSISRQV